MEKKIKGVVLAGGLGTRLRPLTDVLNKHLLPVFDQPMVFYPLQMLAAAGIKEVMLVVGGQSTGDFLKLLKNGRQFGFDSLYYAYQEGEGGIAHALSLAKSFVGDDDCCVVLGDNILGEGLSPFVKDFLDQRIDGEEHGGARVLLTSVKDPRQYGVPNISFDHRILAIEEKPSNPKTNFAVIGVYFYDNTLWSKIEKLTPSERGELEITDVNNMYAISGQLFYSVLKDWWVDAGASLHALHVASSTVCTRKLFASK